MIVTYKEAPFPVHKLCPRTHHCVQHPMIPRSSGFFLCLHQTMSKKHWFNILIYPLDIQLNIASIKPILGFCTSVMDKQYLISIEKKMDAATTAEPLSTALSSASSARYFWNWNKISFCKHTFHNIRSLRECPFSFSYIPEGIYDKIVSFVPFLWISISSEYIVHTKCDFWKYFHKNCKRCSTLFLPSSHIVIQNKFTKYILF